METAWAPTTRYLTRCAFKVDKSSLKSECIRPHTLHLVALFRKFPNGSQPLMHGPALPVPIFVGFHFIEAGVLANGLVHAFGGADPLVGAGPPDPLFVYEFSLIHDG